jgi:hypothetical protein
MFFEIFCIFIVSSLSIIAIYDSIQNQKKLNKIRAINTEHKKIIERYRDV